MVDIDSRRRCPLGASDSSSPTRTGGIERGMLPDWLGVAVATPSKPRYVLVGSMALVGSRNGPHLNGPQAGEQVLWCVWGCRVVAGQASGAGRTWMIAM